MLFLKTSVLFNKSKNLNKPKNHRVILTYKNTSIAKSSLTLLNNINYNCKLIAVNSPFHYNFYLYRYILLFYVRSVNFYLK
jgi:hypothetical protein